MGACIVNLRKVINTLKKKSELNFNYQIDEETLFKAEKNKVFEVLT